MVKGPLPRAFRKNLKSASAATKKVGKKGSPPSKVKMGASKKPFGRRG